MATWSTALDSGLGTVAKTANTITNIVGTVDAGVSMLNSFVTLHSDLQKDKQIIEREVSRNQLLEDSALRQAERRLEISNRLKDENFAKIYEASYNRLAELFNPQPVAA